MEKGFGIDDVARVEYILKIIQNFEPTGIASRNLKECLLSQVQTRCNGSGKLVKSIIENHLEELGKRKFQDIAKKLGSTMESVKDAARLIALFEPRPARNPRPFHSSLYIKPDIFITKDESEQYHVHINNEGNPPLRVNTHYQKMLNEQKLSTEEKVFIREKMKNALYFIKSVEQRGNTIDRKSVV